MLIFPSFLPLLCQYCLDNKYLGFPLYLWTILDYSKVFSCTMNMLSPSFLP